MSWRPSLFRDPPRGLQVIRAEAAKLPQPKPPTDAETRRLDPLMPLYATGVLPLDPEARERARRWFQGKAQELQYQPRAENRDE